MIEIPLTRSKVALIDDEDYDLVKQIKWCATKSGDKYYARTGSATAVVGHPFILMHRFILAAPRNMHVDHIDGNGVNNQRTNLRLCTHAQNLYNRGAPTSNKSGYKGVSWHSGAKRWRSTIMVNCKQTHLGFFKDPKDAHLAYCEAARKLHGEFAHG